MMRGRIYKSVFQSFNAARVWNRRLTTGVEGDRVHITFDDGHSSAFGSLWLRDHCKCAKCWHPGTMQRLVDTFSIPTTTHPKEVSTTSSADMLQISWNDGHISQHDLPWLHHHRQPQSSVPSIPIRQKSLWTSSLEIPSLSFEYVMQETEGLRQWLFNTEQWGVSMVTGVPATTDATEKLARRIAFIRESHYGGFWDINSDLAHGDTAYTSMAISAHTDTTYFSDPVGLQLFHLLHHHGTGGESLLVDGFAIASQLHQLHPQHYHTLSTVLVPTHSAGDPDVLIQSSNPRPILSHFPSSSHLPYNPHGLLQLRYNNHDRSAMRLSDESTSAFYAALKSWHTLLTSPRNEHWLKLQPGSAVLVDNWRVLHGRASFVGKRRLCGAYINWDDYQSRIATLADLNRQKKLL